MEEERRKCVDQKALLDAIEKEILSLLIEELGSWRDEPRNPNNSGQDL